MLKSLIIILLCLTAIQSKENVAPGDQILGKWVSAEKNIIVQVYKSGDTFKGKIVWYKGDDPNKAMDEWTDKHNPDPALRGTFHMTAAGEATWADFAEAIFGFSAERSGPTGAVRRISTADYPTPASRPANSRLDSGKLAQAHGVRLPDWRASVKEVVTRLLQRAT